jgi:hypothetical protein
VGDDCDEVAPFVCINPSRDGLAVIFKAGEMPQIREIAALLRFYGLYRAEIAVEEDALAVGSDLERQSAAVGTQTSVAVYKIGGGQAEENRQSGVTPQS